MVMRRRKSSCPDIERRTSFGSDRGRNGVKLDLFIEDDDLFTHNTGNQSSGNESARRHRTPSPTNLTRSHPASPDKRGVNIEDYAEEVLCLRILSTKTRYRFGHLQINLVSPAFIVDKLFNVEFDQDSQVSLIKSQQQQQQQQQQQFLQNNDHCCPLLHPTVNGTGGGKSATIVISPDNEDFNMNPNLTAVNAELTIVEEPVNPRSRVVSLNVSQTSLSRTPEGDESQNCPNNTESNCRTKDDGNDQKCHQATNGTVDNASGNNNNSNNNNNNNNPNSSDTPPGNGAGRRSKSGNKSSMRRMSLFQLATNQTPSSSASNGTVSKKNSTCSITGTSPATQNRFESIRLYANLDSNSMFEPINLETGVEKFNQNVKKIKKNKKCRALNIRRHTHYYYSTLSDGSSGPGQIGTSGSENYASGMNSSGYDDDEKHQNSGNIKRFMAKKVSDTWHSAVRVKKNFLESISSWKSNNQDST